jgi:transcriptional regulator with XRE-family HTH domain
MSSISMVSLGKVIAKRRMLLNLSQEDLAEAADVHRSYICAIENGGRNITVSVLTRLSKSLQTETTAIVREAERLHRLESENKVKEKESRLRK